MKTENELSFVGRLLLIVMFAGLGYWFLQPLQPLASLWPCVQTVLKGIVLIIIVMYQFMVLDESGESGSVSPSVTFVSVAGTVIVQLIAIFMLFESFDNAYGAVSGPATIILKAYGIMLGFMTFIYGIIILVLIAALVYSIGLGIIWVLSHPSQATAPFAKILFKQPKPNKKVKM